jgi:hypothetical protein
MQGYQTNRVYNLIIGDSKTTEAFEINNDLQVTFDISKSTDNKKKTNSAAIEITNLNADQIKLLDTDYPAAVFSVGYLDAGNIKRIFAGQVNHVSTRKQGTDTVTQLQIGSGYTDLNHDVLNEIVPPGSTVRDVAETIRKSLPGVSRGVYNGTNLNNEIIYGYPLMGSPKEMLSELADKYGLDYQLDDDVLYVKNNDRANTENFNQAYVISAYTGLVDNAYRVSGNRKRSKKDKAKKPGIQMKIMLNPDIIAGDIIRLEDTFITGWFRVDSLRHTGGWRSPGWYTEIKASYIEKVDKDAR